MQSYYLRLEGVNLDNFIYDTPRLNTTRGGGLLLLAAVEMAQKRCETQGVTLEPISTGASSGLFAFKAADDKAATTVGEKVRKFFDDHEQLKHATMVVDVLPAERDEAFLSAREKLVAANRWQQMKAPSVVMPAGSSPQGPCSQDRLRPAARQYTDPKDTSGQRPISEASWQRQRYGRDQKQEFYKRLTQKTGLPKFTLHFEELAGNPAFGTLHNKMAVFYADGNGFGALQQRLCTSRGEQREFDTFIQGNRKRMLAALLDDMMSDVDWLDYDKLRFETLLWGGDELIWVAPAWKGWWLASRFFAETGEWRYRKDHEDHDLTHAAGLVFCHHNAPIHRLTRLARELADIAKARSRDRDLLAYQVLESFDHLGTDPLGWREEQCPPGVSHHELLLNGAALAAAIRQDEDATQTRHMATMRGILPKRRLHAVIRRLYERPSDAAALMEQTEKEIEAEGGKEALDGLQRCFGTGAVFWLHLFELWDYIDPEKIS